MLHQSVPWITKIRKNLAYEYVKEDLHCGQTVKSKDEL